MFLDLITIVLGITERGCIDICKKVEKSKKICDKSKSKRAKGPYR